jgi:ABC-type transport system substrate-binding protein
MDKKNFLALAIVVSVVVFIGCKGGQSKTPAPSGSTGSVSGTSGPYIAKTVSIGNGDPTSYSPLKQTGDGKNPLNEVYETLIDQNGFGGELYGNIAKDWAFNGNDLIVNLYDYVTDSAGNRITANDVVFSYKRDWEAGYTGSGYLAYTTGAEALSDYQVVFHWKADQVDVYGAVFILLNSVYITSEKAWTESKDQMASAPVGTGPYVVTSFVKGANTVLTRRSDYWQKPELTGPQHLANVETITYKFITDAAQLVNALMTGDIDYVSNFSSEALSSFQNAAGWTVTKTYDGHCYGMYPNCLEGLPLSDINLRAALFYAINVDDMVKAAGGENFARKTYIYGVPETTFYNAAWEKWDNFYTKGPDLDLARQYMAKSSYKGQTLKIIIMSGQYISLYEPCALVIGAACDKLGIKYDISVQTADVATQMTKTAKNTAWDIFISNSGTDGSMMKFIQNYFNTKLGYPGGIGNFYDNTLNQKFEAVYSVTGANQANFDDLEKYIVDNYYAYGFFQTILYSVFNSKLIKSDEVKTFRAWVIPGSFTYVQQ